MDLLYICMLFIATFLFLFAFIGTIHPVVPGPFLAFLIILIFKLIFPMYPPEWWIVFVVGILSIVSIFTDYFSSLLGSKYLGASKIGMWAAFLGGIIGAFFTPFLLWIFLMPVIASTLVEFFISKKNIKNALKAGLGAFLGILISVLFKIGIVGYSAFIFFESCKQVKF